MQYSSICCTLGFPGRVCGQLRGFPDRGRDQRVPGGRAAAGHEVGNPISDILAPPTQVIQVM